MLKQELNKVSKKEDLEVISLANCPKLIIPKASSDKIRFLCGKISEVEWSGVLFYSVKHGIKNFDIVEFTVEDIYPMNKGTKAYTEYDLDEKLIEYRMSNPKSLSWKIGMIHSHNSMRSYFSGTDMSELNDNSEFHNYYVSLIVNNFNEMVAKVAFRGKAKGFECKDENGEDWTLNLKKSREVMFTFDLDIELENKLEVVEDSFSQRVEEIISDADKKLKKAQQMYQKQNRNNNPYANLNNQKGFFNPVHPNKAPSTLPINQNFKKQDEDDWFYGGGNILDIDTPPTKVKEFKDMTHDERVEDFAAFVLRLGYEAKPGDNVETALEDLQVGEVNTYDFVAKILNQYPALFEKYWDAFGEINSDFFTAVTEDVILEYETYADVYEVPDHLMNGLGILLSRLSNLEPPV